MFINLYNTYVYDLKIDKEIIKLMKVKVIKVFLLSILGVLLFSFVNCENNENEIDEDLASKLDDDEEEQKKEKEVENPINKLNVFRIRSEVELGYLTELLDFTILQFYYLPESSESKRVAEELIKVNKRIDQLAIIAAINCEDFDPPNFKHCRQNEYGGDSFPKLRLFVPPEKRYNSKEREIKRHFDVPYTEKEMTENKIFKFITTNIPNKSTSLDSYTITPFLNSDSMNKVILFTDKYFPGLIFRGLTCNFYDKLLFATVHSSEKELLKKYNITNFPTLMVYKNQDYSMQMNEPEIHYFTGNPNNVNLIVEFLNKFSLREKRYTTSHRGIPEETGEDYARNMELMEIDKSNYLKFFEKYKDRRIMVLFHTKNKLKLTVKRYLFENHGYFINAFFNCKGDKEFCEKTFKVDSYPNLKLFEANSFLSEEEDKKISLEHVSNFTVSSNVTFIDDFSQYIDSKGKDFNNVSDFNFRYAISEAQGQRKLIILTFQGVQHQDVSFN